MEDLKDDQVAIVIPCYNEERTIRSVILDFKKNTPFKNIIVFNNCSSDMTAQIALQEGALVINSPRQGKGYVVRHIFETLNYEWLIMIDGDNTYPASSSVDMLKLANLSSFDMVVGKRVTSATEAAKAYRPMHVLGNKFLSHLIQRIFKSKISDVFSGYRVFKREFYKSLPLSSRGFEIEVELTLQALAKDYSITETNVPYGCRPDGSFSKLDTYKDGFLVLQTFFLIWKDYKPGLFFGSASIIFLICGISAGIPAICDYVSYKYVYHVPLAILATGLCLAAFFSLAVGLILASQIKYHHEVFNILKTKL
jgi:glycosyltransferase involved in cell wall biosynthesis